jgi:hypothetical protein
MAVSSVHSILAGRKAKPWPRNFDPEQTSALAKALPPEEMLQRRVSRLSSSPSYAPETTNVKAGQGTSSEDHLPLMDCDPAQTIYIASR